ncbi:arsenical resistance operon repressor domain protein [Lentilactobacillus parafarraginis F0439]|uniref:Arsenical resistance operon repressor domain protein n=1 Tax=Lentilactobacillus parafarraginis F0439 TaxID=797515 RepID=G9ZRG9_9LACO|nr:winged helix-turn-helix domain-containing protein [Lentilactobacillus parafarraginis]EHL96606.1 arsenical resistance operon repressor domain protein [Lentilactobacillus parafarraginis F0439]
MEQDNDQIIKLAKILADPLRFQALNLIKLGRDETCETPVNPDHPTSLCPTDLSHKMGINKTKLDYHLKVMVDNQIIHKYVHGIHTYYAPNLEGLKPLETWILNYK